MTIGRISWLHVLGRFSSNIASCYNLLTCTCDWSYGQGSGRAMCWQVSRCMAAAWRWLCLTGYASSMRLYGHPCNCAGSRCPMTPICPANRLFLGKSASWEPFFCCSTPRFSHSLVYHRLHHPIYHWRIEHRAALHTRLLLSRLWHVDDACAMHHCTAFHHGPQHSRPKDDRSPSTPPSSAL